MSTKDDWDAALTAGENGRPSSLIAAIEAAHGVIPGFAFERFLRLMRRARFKNTGRPKLDRPSVTQERQWAGRQLQVRLEKQYAPPFVLERVKAQDRKCYPNEDPISDKTWTRVFSGEWDERISPARFSKEASLG